MFFGDIRKNVEKALDKYAIICYTCDRSEKALPIKCLIKRGFKPKGGGLVPMKPGNHLTVVADERKERCYILREVYFTER